MIISNLEVLEVIREDEIVGGRTRAVSEALASAAATGTRNARTLTQVSTDAFFDSASNTYNAFSDSGAVSEVDAED